MAHVTKGNLTRTVDQVQAPKPRRRVIDAGASLPREQQAERGPVPERKALTWSLGEVIRRQAGEALARLEG